MEKIIKTPPMVGVPAFFRWLSGPSSLINCPTCIFESCRITKGPNRKQIRNAVSPP